MTSTTLLKATRNFQRAAASGDVDAAIHWLEILLVKLRALRSRADLPAQSPAPRKRRAKPEPAPDTKAHDTKAAAGPAMPVMLDPDGFSPGGTPNWFLNLQRLERAGLPSSLAPPSQATLRRQKAASQQTTAQQTAGPQTTET